LIRNTNCKYILLNILQIELAFIKNISVGTDYIKISITCCSHNDSN